MAGDASGAVGESVSAGLYRAFYRIDDVLFLFPCLSQSDTIAPAADERGPPDAKNGKG